MTHVLGIIAATGFVVLCTLLPFLPGGHDSLAVPLSAMAQVFGFTGLLLVPAGGLWMASVHWSRLAGWRYAFAVVAFVTASIVWLTVSVAALFSGAAFAFCTAALGVYIGWRVWPRLRTLSNAAPIYLLVVPVVVVSLQRAMADPVTELARSRAIRNSAPLIADIEQYHVTYGRYPTSLTSVSKDYLPSVVGVEEYQYEPSGDTYNLFFEQFTFSPDVRQIVMYNPRDQQEMTSHDIDLLRRPEELQWRRGYHSVRDTAHPHWKCFDFD